MKNILKWNVVKSNQKYRVLKHSFFNSNLLKYDNFVGKIISKIYNEGLFKIFNLTFFFNLFNSSYYLKNGSKEVASYSKYLIKKNNIKLKRNDIFKISSKIGSDTILGLNKSSIISKELRIKYAKLKSPLHLIIIKPDFGCSTKNIYSKVKNFSRTKLKLKSKKFLSHKFLSKLTNDLENPAFQKYPKLKNIKLFVEKLDNVLFTRMSGSGSSIVLYLATKNNAKKAQKILKKKYKNYWCILSKTI